MTGSLAYLRAIKASDLNAQAMIKEIEAEANAVADDVLWDYELSTWTWKHNVKFVKIVEPTDPAKIEILVGTDDQIFDWVDNGTNVGKPPYQIPKDPAKSKRLRFQGTYTAKTVPGVILARQGGKSGPDVYAKVVHHPGIKPRKITEKIQKKWQGQMGKRLLKAIDAAAKASGHQMK